MWLSQEAQIQTQGQNAPISINLTAHFRPLRQENSHYSAYAPNAPGSCGLCFSSRSTSLNPHNLRRC